jgi:hypothetical protein
MRGIDAERLGVLRMVATQAVAAECFPALSNFTEAQLDTFRNRALMALIAADEQGMSLVDALNRATFTEQGLSFGPATAMSFDAALTATVARSQKDDANAAARAATAARRDQPDAGAVARDDADGRMVIPKGFMGEGQPFKDRVAGELAYFIEEARKKGGLVAEQACAWRCLNRRVPVADALELGKLARWIMATGASAHPERRSLFEDVLVVAEARIEELRSAGAA